MNRESISIPKRSRSSKRTGGKQRRSHQLGRTKLPKSLWQAADELARQHGVHAVAHPLRLDYTRLKQRLAGSSIVRRKAAKPAFVELVAHASKIVIEFESSSERVQIQWKATAPPDWTALLGPGGKQQDDSDHGADARLVAIEAVNGKEGHRFSHGCPGSRRYPFSGCVFVFRSRPGTAIRLLAYLTARDTGWHRSAFRKGVSCGGQKRPGRPSHDERRDKSRTV